MSTLLTTQQAAAKLGVTGSRVRQLVLNGKLPAEKFGRDLAIKESDLKLVEDRKLGRPPKQAAIADKNSGKLRRAEKVTQKLNEAFRKATEDEQKASKRRGKR
jgi:excisionase family DNA binding protein